MAIANPRVHIICGICGSKDFMSYEIKEDWICDEEGEEHPRGCSYMWKLCIDYWS